MIGTTLRDVRAHLVSLASESGPYGLRCSRTGVTPVPASGLQFESRSVARAAARATEQYRAALRRYDPGLPFRDVIVCEEPATTAGARSNGETGSGATPDRRGARDPTRTDSSAPRPPTGSGAVGADYAGEGGPLWAAGDVVDFCHAVAGALFEAIARSPHVGLENAITDRYLEVAETVGDPDDLCLELLACAAREIDDRLDPGAQASLLAAAGETLYDGRVEGFDTDAPGASVDAEGATPGDGRPVGEDPLQDVLAELQSVGLLVTYWVEDDAVRAADDEQRCWRVHLEGYALDRASDRIVTLPIVVGLFGRLSGHALTLTRARRFDQRPFPVWRLRVTAGSRQRPSGLVCARAGGPS